MNPYREEDLNSCSCENAPDSSDSPRRPDPSSSSSLSPPVIRTDLSSLTVSHRDFPLSHPALDLQSSSSTLPLPDFRLSFEPQTRITQIPSSSSTENPYPPPTPIHDHQVSIVLSSDLQPSPPTSLSSEETCPDLECSICFSQFNNIFRCPKMLHCKHTFCLECLARINVKSAEPSAIQCPLCRGLTPLPTLGLPKLATDSDVLSYLPAAMQRAYSIRFSRNKGKLQVKRSTDGPGRLGRRSLSSLRSVNRSLDVGLPSPSSDSSPGPSGRLGGALFRLTGRPACRALLLTSVVMMMVILTGIIIFLLTSSGQKK